MVAPGDLNQKYREIKMKTKAYTQALTVVFLTGMLTTVSVIAGDPVEKGNTKPSTGVITGADSRVQQV